MGGFYRDSLLNIFYASVNNDVPTFDITKLPTFLPAAELPPKLEPHEVCKKLLSIKDFKSSGPDNIPSRILRKFVYEPAEPITRIFNISIPSGIALKFGRIRILFLFRRNSNLLVRKRQDLFHLHSTYVGS